MSDTIKLRVAESSQPNLPTEAKAAKAAAGRPAKQLPTVRVSFSKQLDILRAYAAAGGGTNRMVTLKEVADIVQMAPQTVSLANPFFVDVKLVLKSDGVGIAPASELSDYHHAYGWDRETAAYKLAPVLSKTWFWEALQPRLAFDKLAEDQAITLLAEKATAGPAYKSQLKMILEFLEAAGMIKRENGQVSLLKGAQVAVSPFSLPPPVAKAEERENEKLESHTPLPPPRASVATNFAQKAGVISFDISVRVDMTELVGWDASRIAAFFAGIAQVVSAKGTFEKESVKE